MLKNLTMLCGEDQEEEVVIEAGRVVGEISSYNFGVLCEGVGATKGEEGDEGEGEEDEGGGGGEGMKSRLKMRILKQLGGYLLSDNSETALVALDLAKAIMATESGKAILSEWKKEDGDGEMEWVRQILLTVSLSSSDVSHQSRHNVPDRFVAAHLGALNGNAGCWSEDFWLCPDGSKRAFEIWAQRLSTALVLTCYHNFDPKRKKKKKKKKNSILTNVLGTQDQQIEGLDDFLGLCGSLCCREVGFAVCCLPALVLDLLLCGGDPSGQAQSQDSNSRCSSGGFFSMAMEVGIVDGSYPHEKLTACVQNVLQHTQSSNKRALAVIMDSLDVLRRTTTRAFLDYPNHRKNASAVPGKAYPDANAISAGRRSSRDPTPLEEEYNSGLGDVVQWVGCRYGVVLRLSGLDVAEACVRCNRPCSALKYLDMYCDNGFGGSTECFLKVLESEGFDAAVTGDVDISGFGRTGTASLEVASVMKDVAKLRSVLLEAHYMLSDEGSVVGVKNQTIGLDFKNGGGVVGSAFIKGGTSTDMLAADMRLLGGTGNCGGQDKLTLGQGLRDLGLNHVMEGYLVQAGESGEDLQELWREGAWRAMAWDDGFLNGKGPAEPERVGKGAGGEGKGGFHKHMHECLRDIVKNDRDAFFTELEQGRLVVAKKIGETAGGESMLREFLRSGVRLWSFQELEDVGNCVWKGKSWKTDLRDHWEESMSVVGGGGEGLSDDQGRAVREIREVALKCLYYRGVGEEDRDREEVGLLVVDMLKAGVKIFNEIGQPREAWRCLERLKRDLVGLKEGTSSTEFLEIKKMESEISWALGDPMGAIRLAKLVAERAEREEGNKEFLASVLLGCGSWMALSKTDSAKQVLDGYLKPAVVNSRSQSAKISGRAHLTLAEFLANLYENVAARVASVDWSRQEKAVAERKKEKDMCNTMYAEKMKLYKALVGGKKKLPAAQEKEKAGLEAELRELNKHLVNVTKEMDIDVREMKLVESSMVESMKQSLHNYMHGLSIMGGGEEDGDEVKHVFRFVSIWFKNCDEDGVNKILKDAIDRGLPSWLFIPLVYQLFARVGGGGKEFRIAINTLVTKLSADHPHHCIVQLVALANGKNVGAGVSGKNSDSYLKNVGQEKSDAAASLLGVLRKKGAVLGDLCDSTENLSNGESHTHTHSHAQSSH